MRIIVKSRANTSLLKKAQKPGFTDNFDRRTSDVEKLSLTSGEGKPWRYESTGTTPIWRCTSLGQAVNRAGDLRNFAWVDALASNGKLRVTATVLGTNSKGGPVFRYRDELNHLFVVQGTASSPLALFRRVDGTSTRIVESTYVPVDGDIYEVELNGPNIIVRVNGSTIMTATESAFLGETRMGLYGSDDSFSMAWDDISFIPAT